MPQDATTGHRQRMKDRFLAGAPDGVSDLALLELLLTYAIPQKDVRPLAERLLECFGTLDGLLAADFASLCAVSGVGANTATLLKLVAHIRTSAMATPTVTAVAERNGTHHEPKHGLEAQAALFEPWDRRAADGERADVSAATNVPASANVPDAPDEPPLGERADRWRVIPRSGSELVTKSVLREAIEMLPRLPDTSSLSEISALLKANLHFSGQQTRERYAAYIIRRMFPYGSADAMLRAFARQYAGRQELRDVAFYRFCKAEPLIPRVVNDLLIPAISAGSLPRERLRAYVAEQFPDSNSIKDSIQAIVETLVAGGFVRADRERLFFTYREVLLPSFAFVVHSEFPEPGIYPLAAIETHPLLRTMLWQPDRILPSLYELRNQGLLAKISEIDSVRQFTVRSYLDQVIERLSTVEA